MKNKDKDRPNKFGHCSSVSKNSCICTGGFLLVLLCCAAVLPVATASAVLPDPDYDLLKELGQDPISLSESYSTMDVLRLLSGNDTLNGNNSSATANITTSFPSVFPTVSPSESPTVSPTEAVVDFSAVFRLNPYNYSSIRRYEGLDSTSEYSSALAISADYIVVGANGYDHFTGRVHIYKALNETSFQHVQDLEAPPGSNINFGVAVDIYKNSILVGANGDDLYSGIAYIYSLYEGFFVLDATLQSPMNYGNAFGRSAALYGDTAVIGTGVNNAFVFEKSGGVWSLVTVLAPLQESSGFGRRVDVYGDTMVIGAPLMNNSAGAAFVYTRIAPQTWSLMSRLHSVEGYNSFFGASVAIYDNTIAVGAPGYEGGLYTTAHLEDWSNHTNNTGWVYLFDLDNDASDQWDMVSAVPSPVGKNGYFGQAVSLNKEFLAVGADGYPDGDRQGSAFMYRRKAKTNWTMEIAFPSPGAVGESFGRSVYLSEEYNVIVGSFAFDKLRGAIYLMPLPKMETSGGGTSGGTSSIGSTTSTSNSISSSLVALLVILMILVLVAAVVAYTCGWSVCGCCAVPVAGSKKKKKKESEEEEDSPYTVHSYVGYSEIDDNYSYNTQSVPPPMPYPHQQYAQPRYGPPPVKFLDMDDEKAKAMGKSMGDKKMGEGGIITSASKGFIRQMFPYKVYSYAGYEDEQATQESVESVRMVDERLKAEEEEMRRNTAVNANAYRHGPVSMPSMQSMHSHSTSMSSMGTSDYYGDDRRIFSEDSVMEQIHPGSVSAQRRPSVANDTVSSEAVEYDSIYGGSGTYNDSVVDTVDTGSFRDQLRGHVSARKKQLLLPSYIAAPPDSSDGFSMVSKGSDSSSVFAQKRSSDETSPSPATQPYISPDETSQSSVVSTLSYVEHAKAQYAELMRKRGGSSGTGSQAAPRPVLFAAVDDGSVISGLSESSASAGSSTDSYVIQARRQYATVMRQQQASDVLQTQSSGDSVDSAPARSVESPRQSIRSPTSHSPSDTLVAQARARYSAAMARLHPEDLSSDFSTASSSAGSSSGLTQSMQVQPVGPSPVDSSDSASVSSSDSSVVNRAKLQYAEFMAKRQKQQQGGHLPAVPAPMPMTMPPPPILQPVVIVQAPAGPPVRTSSSSAVLTHAVSHNTAMSSQRTEEVVTRPPLPPTVRRNSSDSFNSRTFVSPLAAIEEADEQEDASVVPSPPPLSSLSAMTPAVDHNAHAAGSLAAARQRVIEEEARARLAAQSAAAGDELKRVQERNRLKEEARLRAEEKARARFALFKSKAEENAKAEDGVSQAQSVLEAARQTLAARETPPLSGSATMSVTHSSTTTTTISSSSTSSSSNRSALFAARLAKAKAAEQTSEEHVTITTSNSSSTSSSATSSASNSIKMVHSSPYASPSKYRPEDDRLPEP